MIGENLRITSEASLKGPFLPPKASYLPKNTLVLDMDDTLLFCDQSSVDSL